MSSSRLTVLRHGSGVWNVSDAEITTSVDRLKQWLREGAVLPQLFRYREARLLTHRVESIGRPLKLGLMLRVLSRGRCWVEDERGGRRALSFALLARWGWQAVREPFQKSTLLDSIARDVDELDRYYSTRRTRPRLNFTASPVYLRTDVSVGLKAGGSVSHVAGVINHLGEFAGPPIMLTTDLMPMVRPDIEVHCVEPSEAFWEYPELPTLVMNRRFAAESARLDGRPLAFVYHRYSLNSFAGARLAAARRVPLVVEYNGSEIWMSRHWGNPLQYESISNRIELLNLSVADLVVVVSSAMEEELVAKGIARQKILMNPNAVEPEQYSPEVDGAAVRRRFDFIGKTVIGFIGTFGPWHGAEVLAEAFGRLIASDPQYRRDVRLLMIGDGARMPDVRQALARHGVETLVALTGVVPQREGPRYLAACDILASPHVKNPDGTPFFGSPTKLFEYMAMGKGIVASRLDQVRDVLEDGRAAAMVEPGDPDSLAGGLKALIDDPARREALGHEARRLVLARHTWQAHTARIIDALGRRLDPA